MKVFASILSFYLLSIAFAPAIGFVYSKLTPGCGDTCSANPVERKDSGCEKQECPFFTCCIKTIAFPPQHYKSTHIFQPQLSVQDNFKRQGIFVSLRSFDIWHPPRFI